ncbi:MAG: 16S rRNA (adenine(1518)-N(6)/adenine(1519)-N(6))-dimethyltransferase RsmA [Patescibacteria group bacterium]
MRKFGQHFLINKKKIRQIVDALDLKSGDTIIEIGAGHGELTGTIIERLKDLKIKRFKLIAIEKDKKLREDLRFKIKDLRLDKKVEIIEGDVLKILPKIIFQFSNLPISNYKIVGNIPYYITGYLFRTLGELEIKPSLIVLTIQKEVAERICAKPPKMNLLAASVQFWAEPEIAGYISRKDFWPQPKVDSAIINLTPKTQNLTPKTYYPFIKILFKQPRKTILNNLRRIVDDKNLLIKKFGPIGVSLNNRPQNLSIEQIIELSQILK